MKFVFFYFFTLSSIFCFSQTYVDMTKELSNIDSNLLIDGNILRRAHNTSGELIVTGKNMTFSDNSGIILNNVIIQLTGDIILEDGAKIHPKFINSYIFCRSSDQWSSKNIIIKSNYNDVDLSKVKHVKKIKGNPEIYIYNSSGKKVYSGFKNESKGTKLSIGRYDIRVVGQAFQSELLFY